MNWWDAPEYDKTPPMNFPKPDEAKPSVPIKVGPCQTSKGECECKSASRVYRSKSDCLCLRVGCSCV